MAETEAQLAKKDEDLTINEQIIIDYEQEIKGLRECNMMLEGRVEAQTKVLRDNGLLTSGSEAHKKTPEGGYKPSEGAVPDSALGDYFGSQLWYAEWTQLELAKEVDRLKAKIEELENAAPSRPSSRASLSNSGYHSRNGSQSDFSASQSISRSSSLRRRITENTENTRRSSRPLSIRISRRSGEFARTPLVDSPVNSPTVEEGTEVRGLKIENDLLKQELEDLKTKHENTLKDLNQAEQNKASAENNLAATRGSLKLMKQQSDIMIENLRADKRKGEEEIEKLRGIIINLSKNEEDSTQIKELLKVSLAKWAEDIHNLEQKKNEIQPTLNSKQNKLKKQAQVTKIEIENAKREKKTKDELMSYLKKMDMINSTLQFIKENKKVVDELNDLLAECKTNWEEKRLEIGRDSELKIEEAPWYEEGEGEEITDEDFNNDELMAEYKDLVDMIKKGEELRDEKDKEVEKIREKNNNLVAKESVLKDTKDSIKETERLLDLTDFKQEQKLKDGLVEQLNSLEQLLEASQKRVKEGKAEIENLAGEIESILISFNREKAVLNDPTKKLTKRERRLTEEVNENRQRGIEKRMAKAQYIKKVKNEGEAREQEFIEEQIKNLGALQEEIKQLITEKSAAKEALAKANLGGNLEQVLQQKQELAKKLASLNTKLDDLTKKIFSDEELAAQEQEIEEQMAECQNAQTDYENQLADLNELTANNNNNNNNFAERWEKIQETKEKIQNITRNLEKEREEKQTANLERITGEYQRLLSENKELREKLASQVDSDQANDALSDKLAQIQAEKQTAENQVAQLTKEKSELEAAMARLENDLGITKKTTADQGPLPETKTTLNQIQDAQHEVGELQQKLAELERDLETKVTESRKQQKDWKDEKEKVQELTTKNEYLTSKNGCLSRELQEEKSAKTGIKSELGILKSRLGTLNTQYLTLQTENSRLLSQVKTDEELKKLNEHGTLTIAKAQLKEELGELRTSLSEWKRSYNDLLNDKLKTNKEKNKSLISQLNEEKEKNSGLDIENRALNNKKIENEATIKSQTKEITQTAERLRELSDELERKQTELFDKDNELATRTGELAGKVEELSQRKGDNEELSGQINELTNQNNELDRQLNELQGQLKENQTEYERLKRKAEFDKEEAKKVISTYWKELSSRTEDELRHKQEIAKYNQIIEVLTTACKAVFDELETQLGSRQTELDKAKAELNSHQKEYEGLKKKSLVPQTKLKQARAILKSLRADYDLARNEWDAAEVNFQAEQTAHANTHDQLTQKQADLQQEQASHQITQQQLTIQQNLNNNLQQQLVVANGDVTRLTNDHQQEKQRADNLKTERDNYKNQLDTHICSISCQRSCCLGDYKRLQKKLTTQRKEIFREINNSLELGLESKELTLKKIITRIEELIRDPLANNQKLQKKLTKAKKTIKLLKKQLAEKDPDYNAIQKAEYQKILKLVKNDTFQNCKKLGIILTPSIQAKIKQAATLDLVMKERNKLLQNQFSKNQAELTQQKSQLTHARHQERWIWISLLVISYLVIIGWLSFKSKKQKGSE